MADTALMKKLQRLIDRAAAASTEHYNATTALNDFCQERYGVEPGDIDADEIIDAVMGGGGAAPGMSAARFEEIMKGE